MQSGECHLAVWNQMLVFRYSCTDVALTTCTNDIVHLRMHQHSSRFENTSFFCPFWPSVHKDTAFLVLCAIQLHIVGKDKCYLVQSSYYVPSKMTENVMVIAVLHQSKYEGMCWT